MKVYAVSLMLVIGAGLSKSEGIRSWRQLESELPKVVSNGLTNHWYVQEIITNERRSWAFEMVSQTNYPLVTLAGYQAVLQIAPEEAFGLAAKLVAANRFSKINAFHLQFVPELQKERDQEKFNDVFSDVCQGVPWNENGFFLLTRAVNLTNLFEWFHQRRIWAVPAAEAEVVSRLFSEARNKSIPITEKMNEALEVCRELPGIPRRTYLYHASPSGVNYLTVLKDAIGDPDQPLYELQIVIQRNASRTTIRGWSDDMDLSVHRRKELLSMVQ